MTQIHTSFYGDSAKWIRDQLKLEYGNVTDFNGKVTLKLHSAEGRTVLDMQVDV